VIEPRRIGFTERMVLRDYAFLERLQGRDSHAANWNFAVISTTFWQSLVAFAILNSVSLALRHYLPSSVNPLTASNAVMTVVFVAMVASVGIRVEYIARHFKHARPEIIDRFRTSEEMRKWWLTTLSIIPILGANALLLTVFFNH
jgi:hypothetical protein